MLFNIDSRSASNPVSSPSIANFSDSLLGRIGERDAFEIGFKKQVAAIGRETDGQLLAEGLFRLANQAENSERSDLAALVYNSLLQFPGGISSSVSARAQQRLETLRGNGGWREGLGRAARSLVREATNPTAILGIAAGSIAFRATELVLASRLVSPAAGLARNIAAHGFAKIAAFGAESLAFTTTNRLVNPLVGRSNTGSFGGELASGTIFLGAMRMSGALTRPLAQHLASAGSWARIGAAAVGQLASLGGIMAAHRLEEEVGLRQAPNGPQRWIDGLASLAHMNAGALVARAALPASFHAAERRIDAQIESLSRRTSERLATVRGNLSRRLPQLLLAPAGLLLGGIGSPTGGRNVAKPLAALGTRERWTEQLTHSLAETFSSGPFKASVSRAEIVSFNMADKTDLYNRIRANARSARPTVFIVRDQTITQVSVKSLITTARGVLGRSNPETNNRTVAQLAVGLVFPTLRKMHIFDSNGEHSEREILDSSLRLIAQEPTAAATVSAEIPIPTPLAPRPQTPPSAPSLKAARPSTPAREEADLLPPSSGPGVQLIESVSKAYNIQGVDPATPMGRVIGFFSDQIRTVQDILRQQLQQHRQAFVLSVALSDFNIKRDAWESAMVETLNGIHRSAPLPAKSRFTLLLANQLQASNFTLANGKFRAEPAGVSRNRELLNDENPLVYGSSRLAPAPESEPSGGGRMGATCSRVSDVFTAIENSRMSGVAMRVRYTGTWSEARMTDIAEFVSRKMRHSPQPRNFQIDIVQTGQTANFAWDGRRCECRMENPRP